MAKFFELPRRPIEEIAADIAARVRAKKSGSQMAKDALLAIIEDDLPKAYALMDKMERIRTMGLKVVPSRTGEPEAEH